MEPGNIYGRLESDISQWQKLLMDVKYVTPTYTDVWCTVDTT